MKMVELIKLVLLVLMLWSPFKASTGRLYDAVDVQDKSPAQILDLRGFGIEEHYPTTKDGYMIYMLRIIHPDVAAGRQQTLKRPVLFNHGLFESPTIWLLNSRDSRPRPLQPRCKSVNIKELLENTNEFLNGPMMLSNQGYDVWFLSMRGTDYSQRNVKLNPDQDEFWNYSLDEFVQYDLPTSIEFIRNKTNATKVGYIGHSQANFALFGLLASQPDYADVIEPAVAVAPVAYFGGAYSIARLLYLASLLTQNNAPFPLGAPAVRQTISNFCESYDRISLRGLVCRLVIRLVGGFGKARMLKGYYSALPYTVSLKLLRHFGQLIKSKRFQKYDYGSVGNEQKYGTSQVPSYPIENIRSNSIVLVNGAKDSLSAPSDVDRFERDLPVRVYKHIYLDGSYNHFDLILDDDARYLVFAPLLEVFEHFEQKTGVCANDTENAI